MTDPALLPYRPCVGVMLMDADGRLWVGERLDTPGAWQMPQGGIDAGEDPRTAALREMLEETGVPPGRVTVVAETADWLTYDLPPDLVGRAWKGKYRGQKQKWFLLRFGGSDADIRIDQPHPEFRDWRWMAPAEVLAQIVPFKRAVYAAAIAEFAPHLG
jgi:putative (di)nucleoside polyphosphate hydrolase